MGIPAATHQVAANAVAAIAGTLYAAVFAGAAGTTGANETSGGGYARQALSAPTPNPATTPIPGTATGTTTWPAVQVPVPAGTFVEGGLFTTSTGIVVAAPTSPGVSALTTGGTFATGTVYWKFTHINWQGETTASTEISAALTGPNASASLSWTNSAASAGTRIYRGTSAGGENVLVATVGAGVSSYTDTNAAGTTASPPGTNTASTFVASNTFAGGSVQVSGTGASIFLTESVTC